MEDVGGGSPKSAEFQVSVSSLTLGTLYEAILTFSSHDRLESFWPSVCQNVRWLIPSRRTGVLLCGGHKSFEIVGTFEHGKFQKPTEPITNRMAPMVSPFTLTGRTKSVSGLSRKSHSVSWSPLSRNCSEGLLNHCAFFFASVRSR